MAVLCTAVGVVEMQGTILVELEDVAKGYRHPSIVDIKVLTAHSHCVHHHLMAQTFACIIVLWL